ncbi:transposase (plasmid) [Streptomyces sp. NBC_00454]
MRTQLPNMRATFAPTIRTLPALARKGTGSRVRLRLVDGAVAQLRAEGHAIRDEDIARLSPLKHKNLNVLGRYSFTASTLVGGALRPLRDPDAAGLDDEDGQD